MLSFVERFSLVSLFVVWFEWLLLNMEKTVDGFKHKKIQGHPTAIFGKISVRKTIWELEFSEHLL